MEQSQEVNTMQDKCDAPVCVTLVCLSHCLCACLLSCAPGFVHVFALPFISKSVGVQIGRTMCMLMCVCVRVYMSQACGTCGRNIARSTTMCHNYARGVTMKTALKSEEAVFTNINIQIEHHIGVSPLPTSSSLVTMLLPLSCHFLCVFMGVCQHGKCIHILPHLFPSFHFFLKKKKKERGGRRRNKCLKVFQ